MKIKPYVDKLNASSEYKKFRDKYKDAFLAAGFFVIDLELGRNIHQIDFYIPSQKKFAAFTLDDKVHLQIMDSLGDKTPEKLDLDTNIDLDAIYGILEDEMKNRNITEEIKKIIAVVQTINGKKIWNINSVLSGMEILKAHVEDSSQTVLKMEKTSFVDIMKKMPVELVPQAQQPDQTQGESPLEISNETPDEAVEEIKKLDKLEEAIEKEKEMLKKKVIESEKNGKKPSKKSSKKSLVNKEELSA